MSSKIYAYNNGSASARALADALGVKILKHEGKAKVFKTIINWGASSITRELAADTVWNHPADVAVATNKLETFRAFARAGNGVVYPEFTESFDEAFKWVGECPVVARKVLNGHSGDGIVIIDNHEQMIEAPLYTKYVKKKDEYRIHVFGDRVIFQQRKARNKGVADDEVNWQVRNHGNGFIFANADIAAPQCVLDNAVAAVQALGLDFGAVDIGYREGSSVVYEVNTAPGLQGKTLDAYVEAFKQVL